MADDDSTLARLWPAISSAASVVAPLSLITALLFYFGYASSRAQYEYFGIDVDTIGLSTQDYVMRSPQPLLTPLLALLLLAVAVAALNELIRRRVGAALTEARTPTPTPPPAPAVGCAATAGWDGPSSPAVRRPPDRSRCCSPTRAADWPYYPLVTPLTLALGAALCLYGRRIARLLDPAAPGRRRPPSRSPSCSASASSGRRRRSRSGRRGRRWRSPGTSTACRASSSTPRSSCIWSHRRRREGAASLERRRSPTVPQPAPAHPAATAFLISASRRRTPPLVLPMDGSVRLQSQFENQPP